MNKSWQKHVPLIAGTLIVVIVATLLILFVRSMLSGKTGPQRKVEQQITMIKPPPPPPDQPPPPPPEEKIEQPIEQQPEQAPEQADASPQEQLGVDADGSGAGDGFGLAARKGGHDLVGSGTAPFKWYTGLVSTRLQECLSNDERVRKGSYRVNVRVRIADNGQFEVTDLLSSTGNSDRDTAIRAMKRCSAGESRPLEMPQVVTLQIVSRGA